MVARSKHLFPHSEVTHTLVFLVRSPGSLGQAIESKPFLPGSLIVSIANFTPAML